MRRLEAALTDERQPMHQLAGDVYELDADARPTRSQIESVRRAAKRLADQGRAEVAMWCWETWETEEGMLPGQARHMERGYLTARTPLTQAEREAEQKAEREAERGLRALAARLKRERG